MKLNFNSGFLSLSTGSQQSYMLPSFLHMLVFRQYSYRQIFTYIFVHKAESYFPNSLCSMVHYPKNFSLGGGINKQEKSYILYALCGHSQKFQNPEYMLQNEFNFVRPNFTKFLITNISKQNVGKSKVKNNNMAQSPLET